MTLCLMLMDRVPPPAARATTGEAPSLGGAQIAGGAAALEGSAIIAIVIDIPDMEDNGWPIGEHFVGAGTEPASSATGVKRSEPI